MKDKQVGFFLAGVLAVLAAVLLSVQPVMSAENATTVGASVTVNSDIDVTLNESSISFGSIDPGTSNVAGTTVNVTIHDTTNAQVNLSMMGDANFSTGTYNFSIGNMSYTNQSGGTYTDMTTSYAQGSPVYEDWRYIADPSVDTNRTIFTRISIPAGQDAGTYTANVFIRVGEGAV